MGRRDVVRLGWPASGRGGGLLPWDVLDEVTGGWEEEGFEEVECVSLRALKK
jgi:hypothetical protein